MDIFTFEQVSNAYFNVYPNNSLRFFWQVSTGLKKGELEVATSEILHPAMYHIATEEKFTFVDGREISNGKERLNRCLLNLDYMLEILLI